MLQRRRAPTTNWSSPFLIISSLAQPSAPYQCLSQKNGRRLQQRRGFGTASTLAYGLPSLKRKLNNYPPPSQAVPAYGPRELNMKMQPNEDINNPLQFVDRRQVGKDRTLEMLRTCMPYTSYVPIVRTVLMLKQADRRVIKEIYGSIFCMFTAVEMRPYFALSPCKTMVIQKEGPDGDYLEIADHDSLTPYTSAVEAAIREKFDVWAFCEQFLCGQTTIATRKVDRYEQRLHQDAVGAGYSVLDYYCRFSLFPTTAFPLPLDYHYRIYGLEESEGNFDSTEAMNDFYKDKYEEMGLVAPHPYQTLSGAEPLDKFGLPSSWTIIGNGSGGGGYVPTETVGSIPLAPQAPVAGSGGAGVEREPQPAAALWLHDQQDGSHQDQYYHHEQTDSNSYDLSPTTPTSIGHQCGDQSEEYGAGVGYGSRIDSMNTVLNPPLNYGGVGGGGLSLRKLRSLSKDYGFSSGSKNVGGEKYPVALRRNQNGGDDDDDDDDGSSGSSSSGPQTPGDGGDIGGGSGHQQNSSPAWNTSSDRLRGEHTVHYRDGGGRGRGRGRGRGSGRSTSRYRCGETEEEVGSKFTTTYDRPPLRARGRRVEGKRRGGFPPRGGGGGAEGGGGYTSHISTSSSNWHRPHHHHLGGEPEIGSFVLPPGFELPVTPDPLAEVAREERSVTPEGTVLALDDIKAQLQRSIQSQEAFVSRREAEEEEEEEENASQRRRRMDLESLKSIVVFDNVTTAAVSTDTLLVPGLVGVVDQQEVGNAAKASLPPPSPKLDRNGDQQQSNNNDLPYISGEHGDDVNLWIMSYSESATTAIDSSVSQDLDHDQGGSSDAIPDLASASASQSCEFENEDTSQEF